jgi:propionyl-CoA carboxylase alpha chain
MAHPRWRAGKLSTGFIAEEFAGGFHPQKPDGEVVKTIAAVAAAIDHVLGERKRQISGQMNGHGVKRDRSRAVWLGHDELKLDIAREGGALTVRFDGEDRARKLRSHWRPGAPLWTGDIDGEQVAVQVRPVLNGFALTWRGVETRAYVYTEREAHYARLMPVKEAADSGKQVLCPMPGLVVSVAVQEGQEVKAGETVAVVEAMKMENVLRAEIDGTVKKVHAKPGDSLAVDAVILEFA